MGLPPRLLIYVNHTAAAVSDHACIDSDSGTLFCFDDDCVGHFRFSGRYPEGGDKSGCS